MLSAKTRSVLKDIAVIGAVFASLSGAYFGFAVAERYRALTKAYISQSIELITILERQNGKETSHQSAGPQVQP